MLTLSKLALATAAEKYDQRGRVACRKIKKPGWGKTKPGWGPFGGFKTDSTDYLNIQVEFIVFRYLQDCRDIIPEACDFSERLHHSRLN